jgi:hypothetical protein
MYQQYTCAQLAQEAQAVSQRAGTLSGVQDQKRTNDGLATAAAVVIFWPAAFFVGGDKQTAAELAQMKGQMVAMGMLFASSRPDSKQTAQSVTSQQAETRSEKAKLPDDELTGSTWFTKDAAGFFTFWLVVVGIGQVVLFYVQLRLIRMSLAPAEQAAKAAQAAAEHIPRVERAYILSNPNVILRTAIPSPSVNTHFITTEKRQPSLSATAQVFGSLGFSGFPTSEEVVPINPTERKAIEAGEMAIFFWGSIEYADVFGNQQFTFYRWEAHGRSLRFAVVGGPPHNHRT